MTTTDTISHQFAGSQFGVAPQSEIILVTHRSAQQGHPVQAALNVGALLYWTKSYKTFHQQHINYRCRKPRHYCIGTGWLLQHVRRRLTLHRRRVERKAPEWARHHVLPEQVSLKTCQLGRSQSAKSRRVLEGQGSTTRPSKRSCCKRIHPHKLDWQISNQGQS